MEIDLIELSQSPYNSPLILVPKKSADPSKRWRMCVDYRMLKKKLIPDKHPLPRIDEILDGLGRAKYFSVVDLHRPYMGKRFHIWKNVKMTIYGKEKERANSN